MKQVKLPPPNKNLYTQRSSAWMLAVLLILLMALIMAAGL